MLELTKKRTTDGWTDLCFSVPDAEAEGAAQALRELLHVLGYTVRGNVPEEDDAVHSSSEVFPDGNPGMALRGLRAREDITQAEMAERLGLRQHHISEMESGKRPITLEMAKRIGEEFNISYKVLL